MGTYTAKTRNVGHRPRSKRLRELGGTVVRQIEGGEGGTADLSGCELLSNKVTAVTAESTDVQYPSAKCLYDALADIGDAIAALDEVFSAIGHVHAISDITNLQTALDGKAASSHTHAITDTTGTLPISRGGTGKTTGADACNALLNSLSTGASDPVDNDYYISQYVNGGTTTTTYHRRPLSKLWNYIKSKADSIYAAVNHTHSGYAASSHTHSTIVGSYTSNGGKQNPNYFGVNKVGALMMNTTVNGNSHYKDWLFMDCYGGNDVGGGVAIGVNRQALGAYIMRSAAARTAWAESAELLGTHNWSIYCAAKSHTHSYLPLSGGTISDQAITANKSVVAIAAKCTAPTANIAVYGVKAELDCSGTPPTNTNSAAIYGYAQFGYAGYFNGGVRVTATLTANSVSATTLYQTSDDRLKDYLGDFHFNLADIDRIPLRFFAFKADKERRVLLGTSAQAVQKVLPEIVGSSPADDGEEYLSVDYSKLALVALDCVRQLRDEVATMKAEMAAMRAEIKELKSGR